ncbi:hypothetical protein PGC35_21575 [Psychrobacillus sp. PGGUH221]|uniref:hypothetical protein n=1 Tax=Psychrobacillus sp. PGGUH221 TaxID=3020058 RepID=UPI0035C6F620
MFYIVIAIAAIIVVGLQKFGHLGDLRMIGFIIFTIFCLGLGFVSRKSTGKIVVVIAYWLVIGAVQLT